MSGPALLPGAGVSIAVPASWVELDLRPATREEALRELVQARVREVPELREHRTVLAQTLQRFARNAWDSGAVYCAVLADGDPDLGLISAAVTVSVVRSPLVAGDSDVADEAASVEALLEPLTPRAAAGPYDTWREVAAVPLPDGGSGARAWGVEDVELPDGMGLARVVLMQTFVPAPGGRVVLVSCSSPALALAAELLDLFDAITATLRLVTLSRTESAGAR